MTACSGANVEYNARGCLEERGDEGRRADELGFFWLGVGGCFICSRLCGSRGCLRRISNLWICESTGFLPSFLFLSFAFFFFLAGVWTATRLQIVGLIIFFLFQETNVFIHTTRCSRVLSKFGKRRTYLKMQSRNEQKLRRGFWQSE